VLTVGIEQTLDDMGVDGIALGSLQRGEGGWARMLTSLAQAHVAGVAVDWAAVFAGTGARRVDLPTYAVQHQRVWPEPAETAAPVGADPVDGAFWSLVEAGEIGSALELDAETAARVVPALSSWRDRQRSRSVADSWRYRDHWAPVTGATGTVSGRW